MLYSLKYKLSDIVVNNLMVIRFTFYNLKSVTEHCPIFINLIIFINLFKTLGLNKMLYATIIVSHISPFDVGTLFKCNILIPILEL